MKISVVTISYNQAAYLEACLDSVARQKGPWEHIIVDPGSTDGSRDIIAHRKDQFSHIILDPDDGPADGLNRGFAKATGDIYYYLNSDDIVMPGAFEEVRAAFSETPKIDVISGYGTIIDQAGQAKRKVYSDPITRHRLAYAGGLLVQPATFIRRDAYLATGGFNPKNRSNWDGELVVDLFMSGAQFRRENSCWGGYRLHEDSITATGQLDARIQIWAERRYKKLMNQRPPFYAWALRNFYRFERALRNPDVILARLFGSRVYGSMRKRN